MANVAINGLGRIGRATLKIVMQSPALNLVAVNDLADAETLAYLLKHDTVYGRYDKPIEAKTALTSRGTGSVTPSPTRSLIEVRSRSDRTTN